jgi:hypothetical protein
MTRKTKRTLAWMNQMCDEIPARMTAEGFGRGTCILHTRLAIMRARQDGIRARALACRVHVQNAEWVALTERLGHPPTEADFEGTEAWAMGIGFGQGEGRPGYDAHVVTVVEERYVLDLTIDQANRPQRNILLRPGHFEARDGFLDGEVGIGYEQKGSHVLYTALPDERGYLTVPDWTMVRAGDPVVKRMLAA